MFGGSFVAGFGWWTSAGGDAAADPRREIRLAPPAITPARDFRVDYFSGSWRFATFSTSVYTIRPTSSSFAKLIFSIVSPGL